MASLMSLIQVWIFFHIAQQQAEFVSVDGLLQPENKRTYDRLITSLQYHPDEKPVIAQIFGNDPAKFRDVIPMLIEMGFDG